MDAADARSTRRKLRQELASIIADRNQSFELTQSTRSKRILIYVACALAAGVSCFILSRLLVDTQPTLWTMGGRIVAGLAAFGTIWFFVRWADRWFNQHADEEFRRKRFEVDMNRASWLVELVMESHEIEKEFPAELLHTLARGLFLEPTAKEAVNTPMTDALATIMGLSAKTTVPLPGGGSVELGRQAAQTVRKESG